LDYSYVAYDAELKQAKGMISATSEAVASQMLANRGWRVLSLKQNRPLLPTFGRLFSSLSRPKTSEIITFSRQLALLIESGIAISRALHLLANQTTDKRLQKVINQVSSDISGGTTISAALAKHPGTFPSMYPKLMAVAEHTGHSEEILRQLADYMERQEAAAAKVRMAMVYPALILVVSIAVVTVLMTVALPPLVGMFKGLGVKLPLTTSILIAVVEFILGNWMLIFPSFLVLLLGAILYTRTKAGKYRFHRLLLRVPLIGRVILLVELGRCCRSMSLMFGVGLPAHEVLAVASTSAGNLTVRQALDAIFADLNATVQFAATFAGETEGQTQRIRAVVQRMEEVAGIADSAAQGAEQTSAATEQQIASLGELTTTSQHLSLAAARLTETIQRFTVNGPQSPPAQ